MAHPMNEHRQHHVEKRRAHHMIKGYASGGAVETNDKKSVEKSVRKGEMRAEGKLPKHRMDKRARGGRTKHGGKTVVNVIAGGHPGMGAPPMMPPPGAGPAVAPAMPPRPPMAGPPMGMPPGGMPPGAPPMGPRRSGGRAYASGGAVKSGPAWEEGVRNGSHPHNTPGKNDGKDIGRKQVVTYKTGGAVEASNKVEGASKLPGGSGGGKARLAKEKAYHGKPGGLYS